MTCEALESTDAPPPRSGHTATLVGKEVIIFGGTSEGQCTSTVAAVHAESLAWRTISPSGPCPTARLGHAACTVPSQDGEEGAELYVFGGGDSKVLLRDLWALDPVAASWRSPACVGAKPAARMGHALEHLATRHALLSFGGFVKGVQGGYSTHVLVLDLTHLAWSEPLVQPQPHGARTQPCSPAILRACEPAALQPCNPCTRRARDLMHPRPQPRTQAAPLHPNPNPNPNPTPYTLSLTLALTLALALAQSLTLSLTLTLTLTRRAADHRPSRLRALQRARRTRRRERRQAAGRVRIRNRNRVRVRVPDAHGVASGGRPAHPGRVRVRVRVRIRVRVRVRVRVRGVASGGRLLILGGLGLGLGLG